MQRRWGPLRKQTAVVVTSILAAASYLVVSQGSAPGAGVPFPGPGSHFSGFSTGANVHVDAIRTAANGPVVADAEVAFSGAATDSTGFAPGGVHNEENFAVVPTAGKGELDSAGKEAYGKGSPLEAGLGTGLPNDDENQIVLPGTRAEAASFPAARNDGDPVASPTDSGDVDRSLLEITQAEPLLYARALFGHGRAAFSETQCVTDGNLSEGRSQVAEAQVLGTNENPATADLDAPLVDVNSNFFGTKRGAADTQSFTYLVRDPTDNTYGLTTETRMTFAPIGLLQTNPAAPPPVFVEILGEWVFRATATGKAGGARVTYEVEGLSNDPDPAVVRIYLGATNAAAVPTIEIKRSQLFTPTGINVDIPPGLGGPKLLSLTLGEDIRAISDPNVLPDPASQPTQTPDGTLASGAADVIRIAVLNANSLNPAGPQLAGIRVGHLEARAQVPAGGIACPVPPAPTTTTTRGATTTTTAGAATTTTAAGATTTTTAAGATTTTTGAPGATTTTEPGGNNNNAATTTTVATEVQGQRFTRGQSPPAQPVTAQPRYTG